MAELHNRPNGFGVEENARPHPGGLDEEVDWDGDQEGPDEHPHKTMPGQRADVLQNRIQQAIVQLQETESVEEVISGIPAEERQGRFEVR